MKTLITLTIVLFIACTSSTVYAQSSPCESACVNDYAAYHESVTNSYRMDLGQCAADALAAATGFVWASIETIISGGMDADPLEDLINSMREVSEAIPAVHDCASAAEANWFGELDQNGAWFDQCLSQCPN